MPVIPSLPERVLMLHLNQGPGVFLDLLGAAGVQCVLAGLRLGMFDVLADASASPDELAERLGADPWGVQVLANALEGFGYLTRAGKGYTCSDLARRWLCSASPKNLAGGLEFWGLLLFDFWSSLEDSVRAGRPTKDFYGEWLNEGVGRWEAFQGFMVTGHSAMADEIIERVAVPGDARSLLDVGGGHGLYSVSFCEAHPQLSATVVDLPGTLSIIQENARAAGLEERVAARACDIRTEPLGEGQDVVLLFNVVHTFQEDLARDILRRAVEALAPGGMLIVLEQWVGAVPGSFARLFSSVAALNFLHMVGGRGYTADELEALMQEAGLSRVRRRSLRSMPGNGVVVGWR